MAPWTVYFLTMVKNITMHILCRWMERQRRGQVQQAGQQPSQQVTVRDIFIVALHRYACLAARTYQHFTKTGRWPPPPPPSSLPSSAPDDDAAVHLLFTNIISCDNPFEIRGHLYSGFQYSIFFLSVLMLTWTRFSFRRYIYRYFLKAFSELGGKCIQEHAKRIP